MMRLFFLILMFIPVFSFAETYCPPGHINSVTLEGNKIMFRVKDTTTGEHSAPFYLDDYNTEYGPAMYALMLSSKMTGSPVTYTYPEGYDCFAPDPLVKAHSVTAGIIDRPDRFFSTEVTVSLSNDIVEHQFLVMAGSRQLIRLVKGQQQCKALWINYDKEVNLNLRTTDNLTGSLVTSFEEYFPLARGVENEVYWEAIEFGWVDGVTKGLDNMEVIDVVVRNDSYVNRELMLTVSCTRQ